MQPTQPPYGQPQDPSTPPLGPLTQPQMEANNYDFILNNTHRPRRRLLPGGGIGRIIIVLGGLLVILLLFAVIKNLGNKGLDTMGLVQVAQNQQDLLTLMHDTKTVPAGQTLSINNQNFIATATLALSSEQKQLLTYMKLNGHALTPTQLATHHAISFATQLDQAATNGTYDVTFDQLATQSLTSYEQAMQATYNHTSGTHGKSLLHSSYLGASLLSKQLNTGSSS